MMVVFRNDEEEINVRYLKMEDAQKATELYDRVAITEKNITEKLTPGENCFNRHGGMFIVNDLQKNKEIIGSQDEFILGGEYKGEICGMLWYSVSCGESPYESLKLSEENKHYEKLIREESVKGNLIPGREILVVPPARGGAMVYSLFNVMMTAYVERGIEYATGECYRIVGYEDAKGFHECDLLNEASFGVLIKIGGIYIGEAPKKKIEQTGYCVYVVPQVFIWKPADAMTNTLKILEHKGWRKETL